MSQIKVSLPPTAVQNICGVFGERGQEWLQRLPDLMAECAERWSLQFLAPFSNLTFNYVTPVMLPDGTEAVLKAGVPNRELQWESAALRIYSGRGIVRLVDSDTDLGVLLLERVRPGETLVTLADEDTDDEATSIAVAVMQGLWKPAPADHGFPTVDSWMVGLKRLREQYDRSTGPFPVSLVEEAESLYRDLSESAAVGMLLHGDLHHDNILSAVREPWLAIDPKGVVGEPAYEPAALIRNLWSDRHHVVDPARRIRRRVDQLSDELQIDRARIRGWLVAQSVLSAWWTIEDGGDSWKADIAAAELVASAC